MKQLIACGIFLTSCFGIVVLGWKTVKTMKENKKLVEKIKKYEWLDKLDD